MYVSKYMACFIGFYFLLNKLSTAYATEIPMSSTIFKICVSPVPADKILCLVEVSADIGEMIGTRSESDLVPMADFLFAG